MTDLERLVAAKAAAAEALATAEAELLTELADAKDAYRADRTPENKAAMRAAVARVQELRQLMRADRVSTQVAGDAFVAAEGSEG